MKTNSARSDFIGSELNHFEEIIQTYEKAVVQFAFTYVKDWTVAEDISQEVFLKVYKNLYNFERRAQLKTWIFSITANQCKDYLRSARRVNRWFLELMNGSHEQPHDSPETIFLQNEKNSSLGEELLRLPIKYREVLVLYYYEDLATKEISELLNVKDSTIRTRLERGRNLLKELIKE